MQSSIQCGQAYVAEESCMHPLYGLRFASLGQSRTFIANCDNSVIWICGLVGVTMLKKDSPRLRLYA